MSCNVTNVRRWLAAALSITVYTIVSRGGLQKNNRKATSKARYTLSKEQSKSLKNLLYVYA
jgi:hypothetical protein